MGKQSCQRAGRTFFKDQSQDQRDGSCALGLAVTSVFVSLAWLCVTKCHFNNCAVLHHCCKESVMEDIPLVEEAGQEVC